MLRQSHPRCQLPAFEVCSLIASSLWGWQRLCTLPQATSREPQTAGVGATPALSMSSSTARALSRLPAYEATLTMVLYVYSLPWAHHSTVLLSTGKGLQSTLFIAVHAVLKP